MSTNRPLPALRAWLDQLDGNLMSWLKGLRHNREVVQAVREVRAELKEMRRDFIQDAAEALLEATEPDDRDRIAQQAYAGIVMVLPWEVEGPVGILAEKTLATIAVIELRLVMRLAHKRARKLLEVMEANAPAPAS